MLGRRFLLLVAVLMGLTALAASIAPRQPVQDGRRATTPTPTPTISAAANPLRTVSKTLSTSEGDKRIAVDQGDLVELEVTGPEIDSVTLMSFVEPINPDSPARFELLADRPGEYPIELLGGRRQIGILVVRETS
jgi:hypothetical protein